MSQLASECLHAFSDSTAANRYQVTPGLRLHNPYLDLWHAGQNELELRQNAVIRALVRRDQAQLFELKAARAKFTHAYAWAVPTDEALFTISSFAPLIEIGAGTGYWASLLRQLGTDIVCYDAQPPRQDSDSNRFHVASPCWTEVLAGDELALDRHIGRTLLLCWPPADNPMAHQTLKTYQGEVFLYIGELPFADATRACTGDDSFFQALRDGWTLRKTVSLPNWELCRDSLYVFGRSH